MSNHVRRLQHQQQQQQLRQAARDNVSLSSFRAGDSFTYDYTMRDNGSIFPGASIISGHSEGINVYDNVGEGSRGYLSGNLMHGPPSVMNQPSMLSLGSAYRTKYDQRGPGSMASYNPSTVAGKSLLSRPSMYAKSNLYRSRSLAASKVGEV